MRTTVWTYCILVKSISLIFRYSCHAKPLKYTWVHYKEEHAHCTFGLDTRRSLVTSVSYTHLRAHETGRNLVCRLLLEKIDKFVCVKRLAGSGRLWSTRNAENIESVSAQSRRPPTHYTAIVQSDRYHVKHTFLSRLYKTAPRQTCRLDWTLCFNFVVFFPTVLYDKKMKFLHKCYFTW